MEVVVVSGAVASGKSTLARAVLSAVGGLRLSTRASIMRLSGAAGIRRDLQRAGDRLDEETSFRWVADEAAAAAADLAGGVLVVDAVRRPEQVDALREAFPGRVWHVHLVADEAALASAHAARRHDVEEPADYAEVRADVTEAAVDLLAERADRVVAALSMTQAAAAAAALAGSRCPPAALVDVIVGGQYGSEGKGNVCSFLAPEYDVLMRVGGPNAGHIVHDPHRKFVHLPSGTLHAPDARLLIGPGAVLSLEVLLGEIADLGITPGRLSVDPQAMVIEDWDVDWEAGGGGMEAIGSTKKGVGAATARKILGRGSGGGEPFGPPVRLARDVKELADFVRPTHDELERAYATGERVMLEGTQGTDLSLHHGPWPHVTSRETTASGTLADAGVAPGRVHDVVMVVRTYPIRVCGTSGGIGIEIDAGVVADRSGLDEAGVRATEVGTISGKPRRIGEYDPARVARAAQLNGATRIALTFADYLDAADAGVTSFDALSPGTRGFVTRLEEDAGVRVDLVATGPRPADVIDRRDV